MITSLARHFSHARRVATVLGAVAVGTFPLLLAPLRLAAEDASAVEGRLSETVKYLSSDELEGRGVGTKGLDLAADYLAGKFREAGLKTELYDGKPFQTFKMSTSTKLGPDNHLALVGPPAEPGGQPRRDELKLGEQFRPMAMSGSKTFDLPLVFVGYGITAKDENYDDYAGIDVKDKMVVLLRHEPQQANPHSVFNGTDASRHAPFSRKISNAYEHGAAGVLICNDDFEVQKNIANQRKRWQTNLDSLIEDNAKFKAIEKPSPEDWAKHQDAIGKHLEKLQGLAEEAPKLQDALVPFSAAGGEGESRDIPVLFCRRAALEPMVVAASGKTLAQLEREIDESLKPHSFELAGWRAVGQTSVDRQDVEVKNVVAVLDGEGPHADETIVIGAHYDHLGLGGSGSAAPGANEIHNGADDNGSGSTVLVEVARQLAARGAKLPRRMVFIAFTGEERGLIGSARYVRTPLYPLDSTVAMINLDMVGRLQDEKLIVYGTGTATEFDALADRSCAKYGFQITKKPGGFGPSDHSSFFAAKIPVLFFFTGTHKDYHRPTDDFDKLNIPGMRRVTEMVVEIATTLAEAPERPHFQETKSERETVGGGGGDRPYFGSIPDFSQDQPGYALTGVTKGGPAEKAGLKAGDIIVSLGESKIGNLEDFDSALRKFKAGDKVPVLVKRGTEQVKLEVTLEPPR